MRGDGHIVDGEEIDAAHRQAEAMMRIAAVVTGILIVLTLAWALPIIWDSLVNMCYYNGYYYSINSYQCR